MPIEVNHLGFSWNNVEKRVFLLHLAVGTTRTRPHPLFLPSLFGNSAASSKRPVALRPRLATGLPFSQRFKTKMRVRCSLNMTGNNEDVKGLYSENNVTQSRELARCLYSPSCREGTFSETDGGKREGRGIYTPAL